MKGIGKHLNGLYFFEPFSALVRSPTSTSCMTSIANSISLWHARLGHVPVNKLHRLSFFHNLPINKDFTCSVCPMARQSKLPLPTSVSRAATPFSLLHLDVWGPYRVSTHCGHRFFLTIVDDHTRMTWVYLLKLKSDVVIALKQFFLMVKTQFSAVIQTVRSDNGSEFFNSSCSSFFESLGIIHQSSCIDTPQQNGIAERKHRHLLEITRALCFQSNVPLKFWGDCILTACYIINRLPSSVLAWRMPFELLYKKSPDFSHFRVFGCLCFAVNPHNSDKFSSRSLPSVFLGYSPSKKGYILFCLDSRKFFVSRNVHFVEDVFPFKSSSSEFPVLFPPTPDISNLDFLIIPTPTPLTSASPHPVPTSVSTSPPLVSLTLPIVEPRRSGQTLKPPSWLKDFIHPYQSPSSPGASSSNSVFFNPIYLSKLRPLFLPFPILLNLFLNLRLTTLPTGFRPCKRKFGP
ncbi:uncharacterized protein [Gossypium hirsutum]|nr:uncharacterized protein LOC107923411 isoform X2 [Gossypium hirsutum]XP_040937220.1 uncharacterized protein LOC107923411 isoform X2 [Gossypium hirsutum]